MKLTLNQGTKSRISCLKFATKNLKYPGYNMIERHLTSIIWSNFNPQMASHLYLNTSLFFGGLPETGFFFVTLAGLELTIWTRVVLNFLYLLPKY